jgi:hypothetical protein
MTVAAEPSPWWTLDDAAAYASGHTATHTGQPRIGRRLLARAVRAGRLRACVIGGRGQILTRREWVDAWILECATPITLPTRRRIG